MTTELNWKKCRKCSSWKQQEIGYYRMNASYCKKCHSKQVMASRNKHKDKYNKYKREYQAELRKTMTPEQRERLRFKSLEYYYQHKDEINKKRKEQRRLKSQG